MSKKQLLTEPVLPKERILTSRFLNPEFVHTTKSLEKMPDQKWHQIISFIKSGVRIVGYGIIPFDLVAAAIVLIFSEVIGIIEELV
jgi:hypothetical protein